MWDTFAIGVALCTIIIYLPGCLLLKAIRLSLIFCLTLAPVVSILEYGAFSMLMDALSVSCNWFPSLIACSGVGVLALIVSHFFVRGEKEILIPGEKENRLWIAILFYIAISTIITGFVFIKTLDGPSSFIAGNDATTHLNTIHQFAVTGNWSIFSTGIYYPEGFSEICAMLVQALDVSSPLAANVVVSIILAAIYPLSMFGLLSICFQKRPIAIYCGSVTTLALTGFPWNLLPTDQLSANLLGFSLVPAGMLIAISFINSLSGKTQRTKWASLLLAYFVSCLFSHPSSLFTMIVLFFPYFLYCLGSKRITFKGCPISRKHRAIAICVSIVAFALCWIGCYHLPIMASTVNFNWPAWATPSEAIEYTITLSFADNPAQWLAMVVMCIGIIFTLFRREYLWMTIGFSVFCILFIIGLTLDGEFKQVLTGFWYTSTRRLAASACIIAIPICSLGAYTVVRLIFLYCARNSLQGRKAKVASRFISILTLSLFLAINFLPSFTLSNPTGRITTAFGYLTEKLTTQNDISHSALDEKERAFLSQVKEIVGDSVVYNIPQDGSAYAYALSDINTYEKRMVLKNDDASTRLRKELSELGANDELKTIVESSDIEYLLLLDYGLSDGATMLKKDFGAGQFNTDDWSGVLAISDSTPGFELILAEEDMRLYRIQQ